MVDCSAIFMYTYFKISEAHEPQQHGHPDIATETISKRGLLS